MDLLLQMATVGILQKTLSLQKALSIMVLRLKISLPIPILIIHMMVSIKTVTEATRSLFTLARSGCDLPMVRAALEFMNVTLIGMSLVTFPMSAAQTASSPWT